MVRVCGCKRFHAGARPVAHASMEAKVARIDKASAVPLDKIGAGPGDAVVHGKRRDTAVREGDGTGQVQQGAPAVIRLPEVGPEDEVGDTVLGPWAGLRLLDGAQEAASSARLAGEKALAILVSCVGRKMLLKQFVEEEIETAAEHLGPDTTLTGFYSYGEIACGQSGESCCLHNQTMTVTVLRERE